MANVWYLNVVGGREEFDDVERSHRNMVEVAIVVKILKNLYEVWLDSDEKLRVGIVSPYAAQVIAFQEKLGHKVYSRKRHSPSQVFWFGTYAEIAESSMGSNHVNLWN
ncbi:hypothetical protein L6164_033994 [Bauhinia variegata]|uniref:Uncharacterized protein n=1 Tax=Bauhinia variegata TaxID=167791 RepID=A0ACB9KTH2_BAUVA|nr:hypothetical protein L6164_033994 [Bauhinia variegata]